MGDAGSLAARGGKLRSHLRTKPGPESDDGCEGRNRPVLPFMPMRRLYFDLDGTDLVLDTDFPKAALADGRLGRAIRDAGIDELVCVGNLVQVVHLLRDAQFEYDGLGAIFELCAGAFDDEAWFRSHTRFAADPKRRVREIDDAVDWWYVDDLAEDYAAEAGRTDWYREHLGHRILVPTPRGDGYDILRWLIMMDGTRRF